VKHASIHISSARDLADQLRFSSDAPGDSSGLPPLASAPRWWDDHLPVNEGADLDTRAVIMKERLAFVLVSRSWNRMALPLLYEQILIRSYAKLSLLVATLSHRSANLETTARAAQPLTWYTKGLEIIHRVKQTPQLPGNTDTRNIEALLSSCPNLQFLHASTAQDITSCSLSILHKLGSNLRHLRWSCAGPDSAILIWLPYFSALEVLEIRRGTYSLSGFKMRDISLPCLHTLVIYNPIGFGVEDIGTIWDMPNLSTLQLHHILNPEDVHGLIEVYGSNIKHLDITSYLDLDMPYILSKCNNPMELCIAGDAFLSSAGIGSQSALVRISVSLLIYDAQYADMTKLAFEYCMEALFATRGAKLKTVRLVDFDLAIIQQPVWSQPELKNVFQEYIDAWSREGVRFEDGSDNLLSERSMFLVTDG
jgi:hypothetical protein